MEALDFQTAFLVNRRSTVLPGAPKGCFWTGWWPAGAQEVSRSGLEFC